MRRKISQTHDKLEITESNLTMSKDVIRPEMTTFIQQFIEQNREEREQELQQKEKIKEKLEILTQDDIEQDILEGNNPTDMRITDKNINQQINTKKNVLKPNTNLIFQAREEIKEQISDQNELELNFQECYQHKLDEALEDYHSYQKMVSKFQLKQPELGDTRQQFYQQHQQKIQNFMSTNSNNKESQRNTKQSDLVIKLNFGNDFGIFNDKQQEIIMNQDLSNKNKVRIIPNNFQDQQ
ncbi:UNKNOWN [Stylonychia lemnae]|uniref:Uncharacterized protein n=1 Tax=Stylonychia lemnae TaxID=5949 RepID=A0A077ZNG1_STYLE|nr:UNKNOWN [Stylonychia lemnae]|eukprot:CDW71453.1 UNKNOWN [Stylonychia lemnae]